MIKIARVHENAKKWRGVFAVGVSSCIVIVENNMVVSQ